MRHIDLTMLLLHVFDGANGQKTKKRLERAHKKLRKKRSHKTRKKYIDDNGGPKWKPIKDSLTDRLGSKCWYTEVELIGAPLVIDHYRPVCHYWWLAFDAENYRVACPWANSPKDNVLYGCTGGKGDNFPLLPPGLRATTKNALLNEAPIILDPCKASDCDLLAFHTDGRPTLNPAYTLDAVARQRIDESKILLNLDHPDLNSRREQLYNTIAQEIRIHEALPSISDERIGVRARLAAMISETASFSTAARFYLKLHRYLDWVEDILNFT